ncbi:hypothetical protein BDV93DRAFT_513037 [Ceratobasidium sp. AG-I]|nr:hypothetical protein BDV93DRAFT_513037 [Ceratobasidium sp. AG-I]
MVNQAGGNASASSISAQPVVVASTGLQLNIQLPPSLRQPHRMTNIPLAGPEPMVSRLPAKTPDSPSIWFSTPSNHFGLARKYLSTRGFVQTVLDLAVPVTSYFQPSAASAPESLLSQTLSVTQIVAPFPNISTFRLAYWLATNSNQQSHAERARLVKDVILAPDFSSEQFHGEYLLVNLDSTTTATQSNFNPFPSSDAWHSHDLTSSVLWSNRVDTRARSQASAVLEPYNEYGD